MRKTRILLSLLLVAGCDEKAGVSSGADQALPVVAAPSPAPSDTSCPNTGLWAQCSVYKRIEQAGLNVQRQLAKEVEEKPLAIKGIELPIARGEIRIFLYADSASRLRDQAKLDPKEFVLPVQQPGFKRERTIVRSANLLVLMNVLNETNRERIANALMAGPPQPPSNRP
jgi:hypothetical protein